MMVLGKKLSSLLPLGNCLRNYFHIMGMRKFGHNKMWNFLKDISKMEKDKDLGFNTLSMGIKFMRGIFPITSTPPGVKLKIILGNFKMVKRMVGGLMWMNLWLKDRKAQHFTKDIGKMTISMVLDLSISKNKILIVFSKMNKCPNNNWKVMKQFMWVNGNRDLKMVGVNWPPGHTIILASLKMILFMEKGNLLPETRKLRKENLIKVLLFLEFLCILLFLWLLCLCFKLFLTCVTPEQSFIHISTKKIIKCSFLREF